MVKKGEGKKPKKTKKNQRNHQRNNLKGKGKKGEHIMFKNLGFRMFLILEAVILQVVLHGEIILIICSQTKNQIEMTKKNQKNQIMIIPKTTTITQNHHQACSVIYSLRHLHQKKKKKKNTWKI